MSAIEVIPLSVKHCGLSRENLLYLFILFFLKTKPNVYYIDGREFLESNAQRTIYKYSGDYNVRIGFACGICCAAGWPKKNRLADGSARESARRRDRCGYAVVARNKVCPRRLEYQLDNGTAAVVIPSPSVSDKRRKFIKFFYFSFSTSHRSRSFRPQRDTNHRRRRQKKNSEIGKRRARVVFFFEIRFFPSLPDEYPVISVTSDRTGRKNGPFSAPRKIPTRFDD